MLGLGSFSQNRLPQLWTCGLKNRVHAHALDVAPDPLIVDLRCFFSYVLSCRGGPWGHMYPYGGTPCGSTPSGCRSCKDHCSQQWPIPLTHAGMLGAGAVAGDHWPDIKFTLNLDSRVATEVGFIFHVLFGLCQFLWHSSGEPGNGCASTAPSCGTQPV